MSKLLVDHTKRATGSACADKAPSSLAKTSDEAYFGTNASRTVPKALWGGEQFYPSGQQEEDGWIYGTAALPKGRRALRIHGTDRVIIIGGPPGRAQAADDIAPGGFHYNLSGSTSAPPAGPMRGHYSDDGWWIHMSSDRVVRVRCADANVSTIWPLPKQGQVGV